jgi:hypothetical protein
MYHLKCNPATTTHYCEKMKSEAGTTPGNTLTKSPVTVQSRRQWLLGHCSSQLRRSCADADMTISSYYSGICLLILMKATRKISPLIRQTYLLIKKLQKVEEASKYTSKINKC